MKINIHHFGETMEIRHCDGLRGSCSRWTAGAKRDSGSADGSQCLSFFSNEDATAYLRRFLCEPQVMSHLRALLGQESFSVWRSSDHEVIRQCALWLVQGRLCVVRAETAVVLRPWVITNVRARADAEAPQPSRARSPQPAALQPPPEANPLDRVDHDAQAMALENAARDGVPFCEECEKARRGNAGVAQTKS